MKNDSETSHEKEILKALLIELQGMRDRIDLITRWLKVAMNGKFELPQRDTGPDPLFDKALKLIQQSNLASASLLQRKLQIGYARAARILDDLQDAGYVADAEGSKPRKILKKE